MARPWQSVLTALVVAVCPLAASADEAEDAFNSLYGKEYEKAAASRDPAPAAALAAQLLSAARAKGTPPALLAMLCEKGYALAVRTPAGYGTALDTMDLLAQKMPERAAACLDRVLTVREKQFQAAKGPEKTNAGEVLIEALLTAADAHMEGGAATEAMALLKRALTTASATKSDRRAEIQGRLDGALARLRTEKQAEDLKTRLEAGPQDAAVRKQLVRLCLVELDDPAQAEKFLGDSSEAALRKYVPAASKGVEAAPEIACMELGEWYRGLGEATGVSPGGKAAMLKRARAYYQRFIRLPETEDVARGQATLALKKADETLARLGQAKGEGTIGPGRWIDLLKLVDLEQDVMKAKGTWSFKEGELVIRSSGFDRLSFPVTPVGSYRVRGCFTRTALEMTLWYVLPVGSSGVAVSFGTGEYGAFRRASSKSDTLTPLKVINGQEYLVEITVLVSGNQADISVSLNDKPHVHWQGPVSELSVSDECRVPDPKRVALGVEWGDVVYKSVQLKMLTGKAKLLR